MLLQEGSFLHGQAWEIMQLPSGEPQKKWVREIPNEGLIRYTHVFNSERVLLTSPKALAEVLVTKNYEFVKSEVLRYNLGRLLGIGLLMAEGSEHKRQRRVLTPAFSYRHIKGMREGVRLWHLINMSQIFILLFGPKQQKL
jgi:cytochrome P450